MKKCRICGRELDETMFYATKANKDGLDTYCKECRKSRNTMYTRKKRAEDTIETSVQDGLIKVYSNPDLAKFTPRQLMQELKARGYKWEYMLEPQRKVMYNKI